MGRLQWFPKTINTSEIVNQVRHKFKMQNEGQQEAKAHPSGREFGLNRESNWGSTCQLVEQKDQASSASEKVNAREPTTANPRIHAFLPEVFLSRSICARGLSGEFE